MYKYTKAGLSIALMSISFFLMIENKYICCVGGLVSSLLKLPHWSNGSTGIHMPILYFGIPFVFSFAFVGKYAVKDLGLKKRWIFLIFVIAVTSLVATANQGIVIAKSHSKGLLSIAYESSADNLKFSSKDFKITQFDAQLTLKNYSNQKHVFTIKLDSPYFREEGFEPFEIRNLDGSLKKFELAPSESNTFLLNNEQMLITSGKVISDGSSSGICNEVILTSDTGETVRLVWNGFWGVKESTPL